MGNSMRNLIDLVSLVFLVYLVSLVCLVNQINLINLIISIPQKIEPSDRCAGKALQRPPYDVNSCVSRPLPNANLDENAPYP